MTNTEAHDPQRTTGGDDHRPARRVVVIGGSLAGLLAAQALAGHAGTVTVVERDRYPDGPGHRSGVPQDRHTHVLLESGQQAMETLLPGILDEMREHGARRVGTPGDICQWQNGRWFRRTPATTHFLSASRGLTDWVVRRRVLAGPRVGTVQGAEVTGLVGDARRVRGVRLRERGAAAGRQEERVLEADLVVDASGRSSRAPAWLAAIGAEPPHEERLETGLAYSTRFYRAAAGAADGAALGVYVVPNPDQPLGGLLLPLEDDRWIVTLSGLRGSEPPTDEDGFLDFTTRLPHPLLHDWLRKAEPVSAAHGFRGTANVRRRYDRPGRRPAGFLATGEALCAFNPIYGQGMSVAALSAVALRDALADPRRTPTTHRVQQALSAAAQQAWDISAGADKNMPGATGNVLRPRAVDRPADWYMKRLQERACGNPEIGAVFRDVLSLIAPASALFAPAVARAVLFGPEPEAPVEPPLQQETPAA